MPVSTGTKIKILRHLNALRQADLAQRLLISRQYLSDIENGKVSEINVDIVQRAEAVFDRSLDDPRLNAAFLLLIDDDADPEQVFGALEALQS